MSPSLFALAGVVLMCAAAPALAGEDLAAKLIAAERASLAASDRGDVEPGLSYTAADIVYIDPWQEKPLVGIDKLRAYYKTVFKIEDKPTLAGEMLNAGVQVLGDTAVLTYNYIVRRIETRAVVHSWNCVEVYNKRGGKWLIVNMHWSFTQPKLATE